MAADLGAQWPATTARDRQISRGQNVVHPHPARPGGGPFGRWQAAQSRRIVQQRMGQKRDRKSVV